VEVHRIAGEVGYLPKVLVPDMDAFDAFCLDLTRRPRCWSIISEFSMERLRRLGLPIDTMTA
jgi:DNA-binding Lrp family transcriptional regulator